MDILVKNLVCIHSSSVSSIADDGFYEFSNEELRRWFASLERTLLPRDEAETDENFLQLVSYVVVQSGKHLLRYRRTSSGNESRLYDRFSVGFGGHVEEQDQNTDTHGQLMDAIVNCAQREIAEELDLRDLDFKCLGIIKDTSNAVARVHLGIVLSINVDSHDVVSIEDSATDLIFENINQLDSLITMMESWSVLLLRNHSFRGLFT